MTVARGGDHGHRTAGRNGRRAASAATPTAAPSATKVKPGGEITYGLEAETGGGWCPRTARLAISGIEVAAAIYDTLTAPNTKGEIVPYLAKSVTPNADFTQWTITLRDGVEVPRRHPGRRRRGRSQHRGIPARTSLVGQALKNIASVAVTSPTVVTVSHRHARGPSSRGSSTSTAAWGSWRPSS